MEPPRMLASSLAVILIAFGLGCTSRQEVQFKWASGPETEGAITIIGSESGSVYTTERPGDMLFLHPGGAFGSGGVSRPDIAVGEGSEIRLAGKSNHPAWDVAIGERLCFLKTPRGWRYICGRGRVGGRRFGNTRTLSSCIVDLEAIDPVVREGAARDIGRLASIDDYDRVVPCLLKALRDPERRVQLGAIESLGQVGNGEAYGALKESSGASSEVTTNERIAEALAMCAGYNLVGARATPEMSPEQAADLFLAGKTDWVQRSMARMISSSVKSRDYVQRIREGSTSQPVVEAAGILLSCKDAQ